MHRECVGKIKKISGLKTLHINLYKGANIPVHTSAYKWITVSPNTCVVYPQSNIWMLHLYQVFNLCPTVRDRTREAFYLAIV